MMKLCFSILGISLSLIILAGCGNERPSGGPTGADERRETAMTPAKTVEGRWRRP